MSASEKESSQSQESSQTSRRRGAQSVVDLLRGAAGAEILEQIKKETEAFLSELQTKYGARLYEALQKGKSKRPPQSDRSESANESGSQEESESHLKE